MRRVLPILALLALALPAHAGAKVQVIDEAGSVVDTFKSLTCRTNGPRSSRDFFATGKSVDRRFTLTVFIDAPVFDGYGREYEITYGGTDPQVFLNRRADEEVFSHFELPGTPAGLVGAGAIKFNGRGTKMGIGMYAANNRSMTEGYAFAGGVKCKRPPR